MGALANQAALASQNAKLFAALQKRLLEVNTLYRISQDISGTLDLDRMLRQVVLLLKEQFGCYHVQVFLADPETGDLLRSQGSDDPEVDPSSQGIVATVRGRGSSAVWQKVCNPV